MADYYGKDTSNTPKTISVTDPALNAAVSTAIVNSYEAVLITLTSAGNAQTIQNPTDTATIRTVTFINNDTSTHSIPFVANSVTFTITPGEGQCFLWDGSAWGPTDLGITSLPVPVTQGGTGAATAQAAINTLTAVASATNEHVLTKDTATGNAIFKVAAGGTGTGDMLLGTAQTVTASKTFGDDLLILAGSTSGTIKLNAADEAGTTTVTFPATTGTVQIAGENVTVGAGKTLGFAPATELTIAAGAVTAAQVLHLIDTESDAASDDLVTINGGVDGLQIEIRAAHTDRTVVIKETGNILTGGSDIRLDDTNKYILFTYDGALSKWVVVGGSGSGGSGSGGHVIEDEGTPLASRSSLNFTGAGVTVTDDPGNDVTVVTINTGGEGGLSVVEAQNTGHVLTIADDNGKTFTCDSTVSRTFDLPSVSGGDVGAEFSFVKLGVGALVIHAADSDTIEDCGAGLTMYCADEGIATVSIKLVTETKWVIKSAATGTWITTV